MRDVFTESLSVAAECQGILKAENGLGFQVLLETFDAVFTAVPRALVAAERRMRIPGRIVDVHLPGADACRDGASSAKVLALHMRAQAVDRVVGDLHRLVHAVVGN